MSGQTPCGAVGLLMGDKKNRIIENPLLRACGDWCLCVRGTAIAMPDWALGGHLAMSLSVLMSAERKRFRLGYLADAAFPHLKHRGLAQLNTATSDGLVAASFDGGPCPVDGW